MKKLLFSLVAFCMASYAMADQVSVEPVSVKAGETAELWIDLDTENNYSSFQFNVTLPEGLKFVSYKSGRKDVWGELCADRVDDHTVDITPNAEGTSAFILAYSPWNNYFYNEDENGVHAVKLVKMMVKADDECASGEYIVNVTGIKFVDITTKYTYADVEGSVRVYNPVEDNANAWAAIQNQIAEVQAALDNYEAIVATMMYASRYEGEELTELIDAAKAWIATTTEAYQAKYEAGELTAEDGVMEEMMEQVANVNQALNIAAIYDAGRYVYGAVWAWYGDDEDIVGVREEAMEVLAQLPEESQEVFNHLIEMVEREIGALLPEYMVYQAYDEETHKALIEAANSVQESIAEVVASIEGIKLEWAYNAITLQIAEVQNAINYFDEIVGSMNYASRYEGEELTELVDAARAWVAEKTAALEEKYEAGTLNLEEDGLMGEMKEQVANVYEAINIAAKYDAARYVSGAIYAWYGDDEEIVGAKEGVMEVYNQMPEESQAAFDVLIDMIERELEELMNMYNQYDAYNEDKHNAIIEAAESVLESIAEAVENAEAVAAQLALEAANWEAAMNDVETLEELWGEMTETVYGNEEYLSEEDIKTIEDFYSEDYFMMIEAALQEANANGEEYESPIDFEQLRQILQQIKDAIQHGILTGINNIGIDATQNEVYNLQGVRVNSAKKGMFIVNGKKVMVK